MWILRHAEGKILYLLPEKQYVVGRRNADLILESDQSVSRKHATITVSRNGVPNSSATNMANPPSLVKLVDEGSKYGTFVKEFDDWKTLSRGEECVLVDQDTVRFGLLENHWRVIYVPLVVTLSNINVEEKQRLKNIVANLDGYISKSWDKSSTHLTMNTVTLTVKAVCALACAKPIVTPGFWGRCWEMASRNMELPDCNNFIPPIRERTINESVVSLAANEQRHNIFTGKHFVFASQIDLRELGCMVIAAGGTAAAFEEYVNSFDELCEENVIVISCSFITSRSAPSQQAHLIEPFNNAKRYLEARGRRVIADQEIGYAILYCSTERYCNPVCNTMDTSSSSETSQNQNSIVSLDFSSQAVDRPTQEMDSSNSPQQSSIEPFIPQTSQSSGISVSQHPQASGNTTLDVAIASSSCVSTRDIFASPIKVRSAKELCGRASKRLRSPEQDEAPDPKRPTSSRNMPSKPITIKVESDDEDPFAFPTDHSRTASRHEQTEQDEFTFANESSNRMKQEEPRELNQSSDDLFGTFSNTNAPNASDHQHTVESCESKYIPSTSHEVNEGMASTSKQSNVFQKRKMSLNNEGVLPPHKKRAPSTSNISRTSEASTKTPVSLNGFLNTTLLKSDYTDEVDKLSDCVADIILVKEKLLVVREKAKQALLVNEKKKNGLCHNNTKNFKKFHKVLPASHRVLPRIIGGKDLYVYREEVENNWNATLDVSAEDEDRERETDDWDFPSTKKALNKTKTAPVNRRKK